MILASRPHYAAHMAPVDIGDLDVALVASYADVVKARQSGHRRIVLMQHGIGQSYSNDSPAYPGGRDNDDVGLFLVPNETAGQRWRNAYPAARVEVVGCPRLDDLPRRDAGPLTIAVTFHWRYGFVQEARHGFDYWRTAVRDLTNHHRVIGHGHPRATRLPRFYERNGIEWVPDFDEVCRRADLLLFDNTSAGYEFASTGRPVVVLNSPWYRREVEHGLRFWEAADVGINVERPEDLAAAVAEALEDAPQRQVAREAALATVYAYRTGAAERAAEAIREWAA